MLFCFYFHVISAQRAASANAQGVLRLFLLKPLFFCRVMNPYCCWHSCCWPGWVTSGTSHHVSSQSRACFSYLARNNIPCLHITLISHSGSRQESAREGGYQYKSICGIGEVLYKPRAGCSALLLWAQGSPGAREQSDFTINRMSPESEARTILYLIFSITLFIYIFIYI